MPLARSSQRSVRTLLLPFGSVFVTILSQTRPSCDRSIILGLDISVVAIALAPPVCAPTCSCTPPRCFPPHPTSAAATHAITKPFFIHPPLGKASDFFFRRKVVQTL